MLSEKAFIPLTSPSVFDPEVIIMHEEGVHMIYMCDCNIIMFKINFHLEKAAAAAEVLLEPELGRRMKN